MLRDLSIICIIAVLTGCSLDWGDKSPPKERCQDGGCSDAGRDLPDGDLPGGCFADEDADGHGDSARPRSCNADGVSTLSDDCDDSEPSAFPKSPEVCDGIDNDCDDTADEELEVVPYYPDVDMDGYGVQALEELLCAMPDGYVSTSGDCNDTTADVSPLGTETCNFRDDDCDGVADDGFALAKPAVGGEQIFTQAGVTDPPGGQVALLSRPGGAWLLYRSYGAFLERTSRPVHAVRLDASGLYQATEGDPLLIEPDATSWAADGDGKWIAILTRAPRVGSTGTTIRLRLFAAADLALVNEVVLVETATDIEALPLAVSVFEDSQGTIRVLSGAAIQQTVGENPTWVVKLIAANRPASGTFSLQPENVIFTGVKPGFFPFGPWQMALEKIPCRDEWLAFTYSSDPTLNELRRISTAGGAIGPAVSAFSAGVFPIGMAAGSESCAERDPELVVAYSADGVGTRLRLLSVNRATGDLTQQGSDLALPMSFAMRAAQVDGRWFATVAGSDAATGIQVNFALGTYENIALYGTTGAHPGSLKGDLGEGFTVPGAGALIPTGTAVVVAYHRGNGSAMNLDALRATLAPYGQTSAAAAVTYRLICN